MNSSPTLNGSHLRTYTEIFQHPLSHNLNWRAVRALFEHLGEVTDEPNGNLKITRNGHALVVHRPNTKDVANAGEVMALRHFLEKSEITPSETDPRSTQWLVVITHHEARIFRSDIHGSLPHMIHPEEYFRHTRDSGNVSRGKEKPDPTGFFKPVAEVLRAAGQVLIFGHGTGTGNEMDQFINWIKTHRPELAGRIIGSVALDENSLADDQLLAKARDFYANAAAP